MVLKDSNTPPRHLERSPHLRTRIVLQAAGFEPNVDQSEEAKFAIRALFSLMPATCYVVGALLFARFAFNEAEHRQVREALAERALAR